MRNLLPRVMRGAIFAVIMLVSGCATTATAFREQHKCWQVHVLVCMRGVDSVSPFQWQPPQPLHD